MRNQTKALLVGGLLVFAGFMLGRMSSTETAYAAGGAASTPGVGVSASDKGGAVLFREEDGEIVAYYIAGHLRAAKRQTFSTPKPEVPTQP